MIKVWIFVVCLILAILVGIILGFLIARRYMIKYIQENPPINEDIVRTLMSQMGRTPSEKQVRQAMRAISTQYEFKKPSKDKKKK
ncbi:MAG: YneF family protein [Bacilli bacterium]|nr:YneF family protein [Bacilli bacterium]